MMKEVASVSAQQLIETLEKLLILHKSLHQLAKQKTEVLKTGDTDALHNLLKEEKKHILAIQKFETERQKVSKEFLEKIGGGDIQSLTISSCIEVAEASEKEKLIELSSDLQAQLKDLKERNELNQLLLKQSLQFVNMSLDLLMPEIDTYNYERPGQAYQNNGGRSIFNSKA